MSCESVVADTSSYDFPFDWEAPAYHWDTVVCLEEIVESLENFLDIINEQAYQFFFENVQQVEIDLIGCIDGVCRPATREASKKYLECAHEWGQRIDWELSVLEIRTMWLFNVEQIDVMMNNVVRGHSTPFSVKHLIEQAKSSAAIPSLNDADIQNINTDFDKNSPTYPPELDAALRAWRAVSNVESKIIPKKRIKAWLNNNTKLSEEAKDRIAIVANWNKTGGAPRTD